MNDQARTDTQDIMAGDRTTGILTGDAAIPSPKPTPTGDCGPSVRTSVPTKELKSPSHDNMATSAHGHSLETGSPSKGSGSKTGRKDNHTTINADTIDGITAAKVTEAGNTGPSASLSKQGEAFTQEEKAFFVYHKEYASAKDVAKLYKIHFPSGRPVTHAELKILFFRIKRNGEVSALLSEAAGFQWYKPEPPMIKCLDDCSTEQKSFLACKDALTVNNLSSGFKAVFHMNLGIPATRKFIKELKKCSELSNLEAAAKNYNWYDAFCSTSDSEVTFEETAHTPLDNTATGDNSSGSIPSGAKHTSKAVPTPKPRKVDGKLNVEQRAYIAYLVGFEDKKDKIKSLFDEQFPCPDTYRSLTRALDIKTEMGRMKQGQERRNLYLENASTLYAWYHPPKQAGEAGFEKQEKIRRQGEVSVHE